MKRYVVLLAVMALLVAAVAMPALAAPGPGRTGPEHARPICSFSELNDFEEGSGPQTQSCGREVRSGGIEPSEVKSGPPSPGTFCNPEKGPLEGHLEEPVEE
jgi:hypothetical protein